ncbi:Scr1 family TA system antitoxin-like transcriptional regulator [Kitasatospora sp. NPDC088779]|uniref:Scr1 family TA system antitoxin-like transcriptional regulator n=1 Tax=unclassified Kitasatospora TaxID=2633591 RepID=UPI003417DE3F
MRDIAGLPGPEPLGRGGRAAGAVLLGLCLRTARADRMLRHGATTAGCSADYLRRVETGLAVPSPSQTAGLLAAYATPETSDHWPGLIAIAAQLTAYPENCAAFADCQPGWAGRLMLVAGTAERVRASAALVVPIGLRTRTYGAAVIQFMDEVSPADRTALTTPLSRTALTDGPPWTVVLGEAVLRQGASPGLARQIRHLVHLAESTEVRVQVATAASGGHPTTELVELLLPGPAGSVLVVEVKHHGAHYRIGGSDSAEELRRLVDRCATRALDPQPSLSMLRRTASELTAAASIRPAW